MSIQLDTKQTEMGSSIAPWNTREVIVELLSQLGSSREAREYLKRFSSVGSFQFAVIKVGGQVLQDQLAELASALHFLYQAGLYPIVLHGAGPQLDQALADAGIDSAKIEGLRVTTPEVMGIARHVIYEQNMRLVEALERIGARARSIQHGVFECSMTQQESLGLVGTVQKVHLKGIKSAVDSHAVPVVTCLGESKSGQVLNVNADFAVNALIREIKPYKVIFITKTGGLLNEEGEIISGINLVTDYQRLLEADWVHSGMWVKLEQIKTLLDGLPDAASVSITSATNLTKELFTHGGAGTLVRKGERIEVTDTITEEEMPWLIELVAECFQRQLDPRWPQEIDLLQLIRAESGRAAAVITRGIDSIPYLDKFAVTPEAQGEGLGAALWKEIIRQHPRMYWRSRAENPINPWYQRQSDFSWRQGKWTIFGYGFDDFAQVGRCVEDAANRAEWWMDD